MIVIALTFYLVLAVIGLVIVLPYAQDSLAHYLFHNSNEALYLVLLFTLIIVIVIPLLLVTVTIMPDRSEASKKYRSEIGEERDNIERQLYELNERLSSNATRWKEANNLILESQNVYKNLSNGRVSINGFLMNYGLDPNDISVNEREVFVLTPFNDKYLEAYDVIKKTCAKVKLNAVRSDDDYIEYSIMRHIIRKIVSARIIVANIDGRNANVMYELGIAHTLNKPTIIIDQGNHLVPFDIQGNHVIIYDSLKELEDKLFSQLTGILVYGK